MVPEPQNNKGAPDDSGAKSPLPLPLPAVPPDVLPPDVPAAAATPQVTPAPARAAAPKPASAPKKSGEVAKQSATGSKRTWKSKVLIGAVAGVVLLGAGTWFGSQLPDPTASDAYKELSASKVDVQTELERSKTSFRSLDAKHAELEQDIAGRESTVLAREGVVAGAEKKNAEAEAALKKREEAVRGAEAQKAKNTFGDGTRTVGKDIEAGTYVPTADVGSSCYWAILTSGTNGSDIVDNDLPGGGRPSVTISAGQDFKSSRCGSWTKQ